MLQARDGISRTVAPQMYRRWPWSGLGRSTAGRGRSTAGTRLGVPDGIVFARRG